jgi:hypothetical protein
LSCKRRMTVDGCQLTVDRKKAGCICRSGRQPPTVNRQPGVS